MTFPSEYIVGIKLEINAPLNIHGRGITALCPGSVGTPVETVSTIETGLVFAVDTQRPYVKWTFIMTTDMFHRERTLEFNVAIRNTLLRVHKCSHMSASAVRYRFLAVRFNRLTR